MEVLLSLKDIHLEYQSSKKPLVAIDNITFSVMRNEFVSIIGPSGSGKSSLIRIILGLQKPTSGTLLINGKKPEDSDARISVVFQNPALFPWLTVQRNVEIPLEPIIPDREERKRRSLQFIKMVGIDGFENAYPAELSGGMKQRVSIARALATGPDLLLLDEPFVGLDVFSAQALREELLDLWMSPDIPPHTVLLVTHNVDEAVQLSDRIVILSRRPSRVIGIANIDLPRPRNTRSDEFYKTVDEVVSTMSP
ncbi:MAG: ABC transporter ATP-binding protein [Thermoplasmataceae archaeon]